MQQIDHRIIKLLIGLIAVFLAFFAQFVAGYSLDSISDAYHSRARDWFVGLLFAVSALFLSFSGEGRFERILTILASVLAAVVATIPCECGRDPRPLSSLHFPAAIGLFFILGYFCWRFRKTAKSKIDKYPEARRRALIYGACFLGMVGCGSMAIVYVVGNKFLPTPMNMIFPTYVFWAEALGLVSFGFSWLAASRTFPLITNPRERFRLLEGRAVEDADLITRIP